MSVIAAAVEQMLAAGVDHATIVETVRAMEGVVPSGRTARQERNARYYENNKRLKPSESKTVKTLSDVSDASKTLSDAPHVGASARVVTPSLPSLRSEEGKNPLTHPSGASPAKPKAPPARSRLVPEGWTPDAKVLADLAAENFCAGSIERELAVFRDHEFRDPKSDWNRTFRKWMRTSRSMSPAKPHDRPDHHQRPTSREDRLGRMLRGAMAAVDEREPVVGGRDP